MTIQGRGIKMKVNIRIRLLAVAILSIVFLMFGLFLLQNDYALACEGSVTKICSILGDDPKPSILDQDIFKFYGTKGEKVTVHLGINPSGAHIGNRVILILMDNIKRRWFFREDRSTLDNEIRAILPATGEYQIFVNEQPKVLLGRSFMGAYCLTLKSSKEAWSTLEATSWVEPDADAAVIVGPKGSIVTVDDVDSPIYGTKIEIPQGVLNQDNVISIKEMNLSSSLPEGTVDAGPFIDFGPDGTQFLGQVRVTIPYDDKDNDGIVDYTGVSEDNISVISWDEYNKIWVKLNILSQDKENNLLTFETNHFSIYSTSVSRIESGKNVSIVTIDGLDFLRTFTSFGIRDFPSRDGYLRKAVLEMDLGLNKGDIYSYAWDGDAYKTAEIIENLSRTLAILDIAAKKTGGKLIIVTHSWGTQLGTLALSYPGFLATPHQIEPNLFITLSDPSASSLVDPSSYINDCFFFGPSIQCLYDVDYVQAKIADFASARKQETHDRYSISPNPVMVKKWINYWDVGDIFSGPLDKNNSSATIDDKTVRNDEERNLRNTEEVHAITSLSKKNCKEYGVEEQGRDFSNRVKSEIQAVIEEDSFCSADTRPTILNTNFIDGGAESTTSTTVNISTTAKDACGITGYWICGYIDRKCEGASDPVPEPLSPGEVQCALRKCAGVSCPYVTPISPSVSEYHLGVMTQPGAPYPRYGHTVDAIVMELGFFDAQGNVNYFTDSIKYEDSSPINNPNPSIMLHCFFGSYISSSEFTSCGTATLHMRKSDGSAYHTYTQNVGAAGRVSFILDPSPRGTYTAWAIDDSTGMKSNEVIYNYNSDLNPTIAQTPMTGPPGTTFTEWGTGFTPCSVASLHFRKPDGTEYPCCPIAMLDSTGHFEISYTAPLDKPLGWYTWWAIDDTTGIKSNEVSYEITSGDGGGYGEVPP